MYRMYSRQLRFLSLFLIFSLSARRAGILKHFSNLPLLSNTLIVKSQSTAIFCPLELVTIWHGSFISSTPLHHPDQVSMIHYHAPYPVYAAPKLSLRHAASHLSPLLYQLWAIPGAVNSYCIKLVWHFRRHDWRTDTGNDFLCSSLLIKQTPPRALIPVLSCTLRLTEPLTDRV